jgi:hypothetical protein
VIPASSGTYSQSTVSPAATWTSIGEKPAGVICTSWIVASAVAGGQTKVRAATINSGIAAVEVARRSTLAGSVGEEY